MPTCTPSSGERLEVSVPLLPLACSRLLKVAVERLPPSLGPKLKLV